ncbi:hypothetical protein [Mesorhizobium sp.]|uniref:hypothetical protein n=1 Tax=Mesorhizobium sp. TaxID=1871066 RepID=UPI000FE7003B|nr:hypothetical protein [Mesorhizobium sp.]RWP46262.1 MAG: hypothetical protein EOR06_30575 [Mesorhizobium sp.]
MDHSVASEEAHGALDVVVVDAAILLDLLVRKVRQIVVSVAPGDDQKVELDGVQFDLPPQLELVEEVDLILGVIERLCPQQRIATKRVEVAEPELALPATTLDETRLEEAEPSRDRRPAEAGRDAACRR